METIFLQRWLHNIMRRRLKDDGEYRQFIGKDSLADITSSDVQYFQLYKLKRILNYAYDRSPFYHELFTRYGVNPNDILSLDALVKVPFTESSHISKNPYNFSCVSLGEIARSTVFTTSGTTGPRKKVFWTKGDLETITDFMGAGMKSCVVSDDVVQIMLRSGRPNSCAELLAKGLEKVDAFPVISDISLGTEEHIRAIEEHHPDVLFGRTASLYRMSKEAQEKHDLAGMGLKAVFVTSGYLSETMRKELENIWDCPVFVHYGLNEMGMAVAVECEAHEGYHYDQADFLVEVVDPRTGVTLDKDKKGELVITTLSREAMPLIRYRTNDISCLLGSPCECGSSTLQRIGKIIKNIGTTVKIGEDVEIFPSLFEELLYSHSNVIDYRVLVSQTDGRDVLTIKVEVNGLSDEVRKTINEVILRTEPIKSSLESGKLALPRIELVNQGEFASFIRTRRPIIDERTHF